MKRNTLSVLGAAALLIGAATLSHAAPFTQGNLVIYRVGDGSATLTNASTLVFLDEYSPTGTLVQSIALPGAASGSNQALTASGSASSEGLITRSADGQFLAVSGYASAPGVAGIANTASATVPRAVGILGATGAINTSTALTDFSSANNPRGAFTTNGTDIFVTGGAGGIRYTTAGSTTSTQLSTTTANLRNVAVFGGQLYVSTGSGTAVRLGTVGTGVPTTAGQTITNLPGIPLTGSPYQFALTDLSTAVAGVDTLYIADDTPGTIQKFSLVSGTWTANGTITAAGVRGLTLSTDANGNVNLFGTTTTTLVGFADTTGYNGTVTGAANTLATVAPNEAFRGIAFTPVPEPSTWALCLVAVAGLAVLARRRMLACD